MTAWDIFKVSICGDHVSVSLHKATENSRDYILLANRRGFHSLNEFLSTVIIKITISSIVVGLKDSCFPLIHLLSCYWTGNKLITFKVVV